MRLLDLVNPEMRPVVPLAPHYARPVRYDTAKLRGLLGDVDRTPLADVVAATGLARRRGAGVDDP